MSKLHAVLEALTLCLSCLIASFSLWAWLDKPQSVGIPLPQGAAVFETSLQSRISSTDTSMTLVSNSLRGGESLSGYNCFTLDEGRSDSEFVCGSVSGTSVTSLERGLSFANGTTSVTANKFAHRVGANVKITDFPLIQRQRNILNGEETVPNPLLLNGATSSGIIVYSSAPSFQPGSNQLITANYADGIAAQGAATSSESAGGISILATAIRQASSTDLGANQPLVLQAKYASSTPRLGCNGTATRGALCTVIAQNDGMIHPNFLATTSSYTYRIDFKPLLQQWLRQCSFDDFHRVDDLRFTALLFRDQLVRRKQPAQQRNHLQRRVVRHALNTRRIIHCVGEQRLGHIHKQHCRFSRRRILPRWNNHRRDLGGGR